MKQFNDHKDDWKRYAFPGAKYVVPGSWRSQCNEFVRDAHVKGDPDAKDYPTVNHGGYTTPRAQDLASPRFRRDRLEYIDDIKQAQPGDIIVWHGSHTDKNGEMKYDRHVGIYVGKKEGVIYQTPDEGLKRRTLKDIDNDGGFGKIRPVIRRYKY